MVVPSAGNSVVKMDDLMAGLLDDTMAGKMGYPSAVDLADCLAESTVESMVCYLVGMTVVPSVDKSAAVMAGPLAV